MDSPSSFFLCQHLLFSVPLPHIWEHKVSRSSFIFFLSFHMFYLALPIIGPGMTQGLECLHNTIKLSKVVRFTFTQYCHLIPKSFF
jgi:hypothetical protein